MGTKTFVVLVPHYIWGLRGVFPYVTLGVDITIPTFQSDITISTFKSSDITILTFSNVLPMAYSSKFFYLNFFCCYICDSYMLILKPFLCSSAFYLLKVRGSNVAMDVVGLCVTTIDKPIYRSCHENTKCTYPH